MRQRPRCSRLAPAPLAMCIVALAAVAATADESAPRTYEATPTPAPAGCPIEILGASVQESPPLYRVTVRNGSRKKITRVDLRWTARDGSGATLRDAIVAYSYGKALKPGAVVEWVKPAGRPQAGTVAFAVGAVEARFADGSEWLADPLTAVRLAAEMNDPEAQYALGLRYRDGRGLAQDAVLSCAWLNLAVAWGHTEARAARDALPLTDEQREEALRISRSWLLLNTFAPPEE